MTASTAINHGKTRRRGGPLVMLMLVLTAWTGARAVWWENPFAPIRELISAPFVAVADPAPLTAPDLPAAEPFTLAVLAPGVAVPLTLAAFGFGAEPALIPQVRGRERAQLAAAQQSLWGAAMRQSLFQNAGASGFQFSPGSGAGAEPKSEEGEPLFLPPRRPLLAANTAATAAPSRWSLDAWAFWRQGSNTAPASQGRVPIYGASQIGVVLHHQVAATSARDPRLYSRAYRALVPGGESELALGASLRPVAKVPLRVAGELRYTDGAFTNELRPAGFAVTELAPIPLAYGAQVEADGPIGRAGQRDAQS
jgi:hypothetical protein